MPGANRAKRFIMTIAPYNISRPQIKPDWSLPASDPAVFVFASWSRVLAEAKPENKLGIFGFIAEDAVTYLHVHRQRVVDDLLLVAGETGLVDLVGATNVQAAIAGAFDRGAV
jgi:hypothetical protein